MTDKKSDEKRYPEPTVGTLIVNKEGKILLCRSPKWLGKFVVPGGHIELGESIKETAIREAKEETGLDVEFIKIMSFDECIFSPEFNKNKHFVFFNCLCKVKDDKVKLDNNELKEYVWADVKDALKMDLASFSMAFVKQYAKEYAKIKV